MLISSHRPVQTGPRSVERENEMRDFMSEVKGGEVAPEETLELTQASADRFEKNLIRSFSTYEAKDNNKDDTNRARGEINWPGGKREPSVKVSYSGDTQEDGSLDELKGRQSADTLRDVKYEDNAIDAFYLRRDGKNGRMTMSHIHIDRTGSGENYKEEYPSRY